MTVYESPVALREALERRLQNRADAENLDLGRLRRMAVFERIIVRLNDAEPGMWIIKGGLAMEVRFGPKARTTKDLDLALREQQAETSEVRDRLIEALASDPDDDGFRFQIGEAKEMTEDVLGQPGWRFTVEALLAGKQFAAVRLDVVSREVDVAPPNEIEMPALMSFAGMDGTKAMVISPEQHFAEKLHALTRDYGDRENTRVRDLGDLTLLIDEGFADLDFLAEVCANLFAARGRHPLPTALPNLPASWELRYEDLAEQEDLPARTLAEAVDLIRHFWNQVQRRTNHAD